jgi:hypothetical protein
VTFTLAVDAARWRRQQDDLFDAEPELVPVIKGNGYGFGNDRLGVEAARLGVGAVAVGTAADVAAVRRGDGRGGFTGDVLVMAPWHPALPDTGQPADDTQVIRTLAHPEAVLDLAQRSPGARVVIEVLTSMRRHGVTARDLALLLRPLESLTVEGFALHLPLDRGPGEDATSEVDRWAGLLADANLHPRTLFVSHLSERERAQVRAFLPGARVRPRIGTDLWLGDRGAFDVEARVLDVHPVRKGDRVVSGGTAHGVGLEAPVSAGGVAGRGRAAARGGLEAVGVSPSPFRLAGKRLRFAEPPHMQVSMLWASSDAAVPRLGDTLECRVRMTTSHFDAVTGL